MSVAIFKDIPDEDIKKVITIMKNDHPTGIHPSLFIQVILNWKNQGTNCETRVLAPNGNYEKGVVWFYIKYVNKLLEGSLYAWTEEGKQLLSKALIDKQFCQQERIVFTALNEEICQVVTSSLAIVNWRTNKDHAFFLSAQKALCYKITIPDGLEVKNLTIDHSQIVNCHWSFKSDISEEIIKAALRYNISCGLFVNGKLVSWALHTSYGGIGFLYTLSEYRKKGYGTLVIKSLCKQLAVSGIDSQAFVVPNNQAGINFFKKLNFDSIGEAIFVWNPNCGV